MTPAEIMSSDLADVAQEMRDRAEPFAFATIVRTAGSTAAKPGAKALLGADGTILHGWLGGGCTRGAVKKAAVAALQDGKPQLISVAPEELLAERGVSSGDEVDGTTFARNGCPSKGTVDIFIEPCMPMPQLVVFGTSPVANALTALAPQFHWAVTETSNEALEQAVPQRMIVIATQGQGDVAALEAALGVQSNYVAFVGSQRKFKALAEKLTQKDIPPAQIAAVRAPAGLDLGAVTPEEIALSILAELVRVRRSPDEAPDG
jgi:xanthine dehydrogenase accessory factor